MAKSKQKFADLAPGIASTGPHTRVPAGVVPGAGEGGGAVRVRQALTPGAVAQGVTKITSPGNKSVKNID